MRDDLSQGELAAASGMVASVGAGGAEATIVLPRVALPGTGLRLRRRRLAVARLNYGVAALGALLAGCASVVVFASAGQTVLVPSSRYTFPGWDAGPLGGIFGHLIANPRTLEYGFSAVLVAMLVAYGVALMAVRTLSMRTIAIAVVALHAVMLLSPQLAFTDLFNYLGYARLGALHHLNPYTHVIGAVPHDPVYGLSTWHNWLSPYGEAFTLATYPLGLLPLPIAYWVLKTATVLASLGFVALVWRCARQLGRDPRFAVLFVAANPIFLIYELGGFHNDVFMLVPAMAAISFVLDGRDRSAGAALMLAVAVKFSMVLLLPFLLLAARPIARRARFLTGMALGAVPLAVASIVAFGLAIPNLTDQSGVLTAFSGPNLVGLLIGVGGGAPMLLRLASVAAVVAVALLAARVARGRCDWLSGAGLATLVLIASLSWLMPWYVVWLLPLAALAPSVRLRRTAIALTLFLILSFVPVTGIVLAKLHLDPMGSSVDQAANAHLVRLAR